MREIGAGDRHEVSHRSNHRAENSHQPFRRRERAMQRIRRREQHIHRFSFQWDFFDDRRTIRGVGARFASPRRWTSPENFFGTGNIFSDAGFASIAAVEVHLREQVHDPAASVKYEPTGCAPVRRTDGRVGSARDAVHFGTQEHGHNFRQALR